MNTDFLIKALQLILSLSILVILHELGHFIPAKLFKTRVEKFFLFFDVKFALAKKKIGDTIYGIGWLPLGGYVKISGMVDESMDAGQLKKDPEPWEFRSKSAWQRLIIMLGGIIVNVILAFFLYSMILGVWGKDIIDRSSVREGLAVDRKMKVYGFQDGDMVNTIDGEKVDVLDITKHLLLRGVKTVNVTHKNGNTETLRIPDTISKFMFKNNIRFSIRTKAVIEKLSEDGAAKQVGLEAGDCILSIDNMPTESVGRVVDAIQSGKESIAVTVMRNKDTIIKNIMPINKKIGVMFKNADVKIIHKDYGFGESIIEGISYGAWSIYDYVAQLSFLFTKKGAQNIGGLGSIGSLFPSVWDWQMFWERTALLSVILAVMNLLPIPALDGGHVVFLIYEMITQKKPHQKVLEFAQIIGVILIMGLMIYANGNDIYKFFIQ